MNVLFYRYNSICEPAYIAALKMLKLNVIQEKAEMTNKSLTPEQMLNNVKEILDKQKIMFVMSINYFPVLSAVCNIYNIPYVSIIVDSPLRELYSDTVKNPCNRIFVFDRALYLRHVNQNPDCIFHMPLFADIESMGNVIKRNSHLHNGYKTDVSFIGSLYTEKSPYNKLTGLSEYAKGYCDGLIKAQRRIYGYNMIYDTLPESVVEEFEKCPGIYNYPENYIKDYKAQLAYDFLNVKVSELDRIKLLTSVSEKFELDIYTGSDTSMMPKAKNRGFATSLFDMPLIFHNSRINLQITARTIETGLSQRVWDVMAAGGFLLMNYQEELFDYFVPGEDMDYFESEEDMLAKIDYYLKNDDVRAQIAKNGYEKIVKYHSPSNRISQIIKLVFDKI